MATANIIVGTAASIPTPPAGEATLFVDTSNNNILSLKLSDGSVRVYSAENLAECCSCEIAKKYMEDIACALKSGMLNASQFAGLISQGLTVEANETTNEDGSKTCTVNIGSRILHATPIGATVSDPGDLSVGAGVSTQLSVVYTPSGSDPRSLWVSHDPSVGTVTTDGLFTPIAPGTATVEVFSIADPSVHASRVITVVS